MRCEVIRCNLHYLEFAFYLIIVTVIAYFLLKIIDLRCLQEGDVKLP